jgi:hypothetical protein
MKILKISSHSHTRNASKSKSIYKVIQQPSRNQAKPSNPKISFTQHSKTSANSKVQCKISLKIHFKPRKTFPFQCSKIAAVLNQYFSSEVKKFLLGKSRSTLSNIHTRNPST